MSFATASEFGTTHSQETDGLKQLFDGKFAEINETLNLAQGSWEISWCSCCDNSCCDTQVE
jgi:hypothetical protein